MFRSSGGHAQDSPLQKARPHPRKIVLHQLKSCKGTRVLVSRYACYFQEVLKTPQYHLAMERKKVLHNVLSELKNIFPQATDSHLKNIIASSVKDHVS